MTMKCWRSDRILGKGKVLKEKDIYLEYGVHEISCTQNRGCLNLWTKK